MKIELEKISYEEKDAIGYIVINDPPANKMTPRFFLDMVEIVEKYIDVSKLKGIIIYGEGRHFSSGADVDKLIKVIGETTVVDESGNVKVYAKWYIRFIDTFDKLYKLDIPVISVINGCCVGSGFELALSSHIRICGKGATMGLPESTFGLLPGVLGSIRLTQLVGMSKAMELIFSGQLLNAEEAKACGIVEIIVGKRETLDYAERLMRYIISSGEKYDKACVKQYIKALEEEI